MINNPALEKLKQRMGPADELQIRAMLKVDPAQHILLMLKMQAMVINMWRARLAKRHPDLSELELCRLMFDRLQNPEKYHDA